MEFEAIKKYLEKEPKQDEPTKIHELPHKFFDPFILKGLQLDLVEPDRILCSFKVPSRLLNSANTLHGGAIASLVDLVGSAAIYASGAPTSGVSVEINVSYLDAAFADTQKWSCGGNCVVTCCNVGIYRVNRSFQSAHIWDYI